MLQLIAAVRARRERQSRLCENRRLANADRRRRREGDQLLHQLSGFDANRAPLSGRDDDTPAAEEADDPDARSAYPRSATSSRLALCALIIATALILATFPVAPIAERISAQDGGTTNTPTTDPDDSATTTATTGELVVVPGEVQMGQTVLAVGFHVVPFDLQVEIHYSGHFTPEGESCDNAGTAGSTQAAAAPTWVTLNACTVGDGYVRMVESATAKVIKNVSVTVTQPGVAGQQARTTVTISDLASTELVPRGSGDRFSVSVAGLEGHKEYNLHTVVLNSLSAAFNRGCTSFKVSDSIVGLTSTIASHTVYGCVAPGNRLWSYVEEVGGRTIASTSITANPVNVKDPTISFSSSSYSVDEESSITIPVELSHRSSHVIRVPIKVSGSTDQRVTFANRSTSGTFTYTAPDDSDCEDETVNLSFGTLPSTVSRTPSPSGATVTIRDNDVCASFGSASYSVDEGSSTTVTVSLSRASSQELKIPISVTAGRAESGDYVVSGLTNGKLPITAGKTSGTFTIRANQEIDRNDRDDETVNLQIGDPPPGVAKGTLDSAIVTILDDEDVSVSFEHPSYTVLEGDSISIDVELNGRRSEELEIPITVSNGAAEDDDYDVDDLEDGILILIFSAWHNSKRFWIDAEEDDVNDAGETVNLGFGTLPEGVRKGSPSSATVTIDEPNDPPTFKEGSRTIRSVAENTVPNTDIGEPVTATDDNGDTLNYSLSNSGTNTDADSFSIVTRTGQIRTSDPLNFEEKNRYSVTVTVDDGRGGEDSIRVTINVDDVNERPGKPLAPTVTAGGETSLNVEWSAPSNTGPPIDDYDVQYRVDGSTGPFTDANYDGTDTHTTISNLTPGTAYEVQVRATNAEGMSDWSASRTRSTDAPAVPTITIEAKEESVAEGAQVEFTLTADPAPAAMLTVKVSVGETGLFLSGAPPSQIRIAAGSTTGQIVLQTMDDGIDEPDGDIDATILPGTGYSVGNPSSATVTVEDNDDPPLPTVTLARHPDTDSVIDEGDDAIFTLKAAPAPTADLAVRVNITEKGSFILPGESLARTITIRAGETTADFTVQTMADDEDEPNGAITVKVVPNDTKFALGDPFVAVVIVNDNDVPPAPTGLRANGHLDDDGNVTLRWNSVTGATSYAVRYAKEICSHYTVFVDDTEIERARCAPGDWSLPISADTTETTLGGLTENTLYRIEVRSKIVSDSSWSEHDFALVFPTDSPLGDRTVATAPFHGYQRENAQGSHEFRYVTCTGTISTDLETPDRNAVTIARDIENAAEKWESTLVWDEGGHNIVKATSYRPAGGENCTHPLEPLPFTNFLAEIPSGEDRFEVKFVSNERIEAACDPTNKTDDPIPGCWVSASWLSPGIDQITKGTILINKSLKGTHWNAQIAGADSCTRLHELVIHEAGHAFGIGKTVAEVIPRINFDFNRHPINTEHSVMSYEDPHRDCEPQAYDIVALMALYQSR